MAFRFNQVTLDTYQYRLSRAGEPVSVEPQVFDLLVYLIEHRDRVVTRDELLQNLWRGKVVGDAALGVRLKDARKAVGDDGSRQQVIKTIHGRGYQFIAEVTTEPDPNQSIGFPSKGKLSLPDKPSIVVLPFRNLSDGDGAEFFAEGIGEEIMMGLSRFREVMVVALGSSIEADAKFGDSVRAARELGVHYALSGSVQIVGERARVMVHLVDSASGQQIWAEKYDDILDDIFRVQDELTIRILHMIVGQIEQSDLERSLKTIETDLSAYEIVLRGKHIFDDWHASRERNSKAREHFVRAVELDPGYAPAYTWLAATYLKEIEQYWSEDREETCARCLEYAHRAVELDDRDSVAHNILSGAYWHVKSDFERARYYMLKALELNPNYYWNYCYGGWFCTCDGDLDTGVELSDQAIRLNPLVPDGCLYTLVFTGYLLRRYEDGIEAFARMSNPDPECFACVAACHAQLGNEKQAAMAADEFRARVDTAPVTHGDWIDYLQVYGKFRHAEPVQHLVDGLEKAGLLSI